MMSEIDRLFGPFDRPMTRRELLRRMGRGSMYAGVVGLLAACGVQGQRQERQRLEPLPPKAGELQMANWPAYIDRAGGTSPTIEEFQDEADVAMQYDVVINDNEEFFGTLREELARGQSTGYDIIVVSDWLIAKMAGLGYLERLHHEELPNFEANADEKFKDPHYDPGNAHSIPWAAGITGIGYDISLTERELTSIDDLFDPAFAGHVGMFLEMRDTYNFALLRLGKDPLKATLADVEEATQMLLDQKEQGIVRGYYGNDYLDQLAAGNLWVSMAWSGDVFALQLDNPNLKFVLPEEGGTRWVDNMAIPAGAEHPTDAHLFMDFVYQPDIAAQITEWVWYESPVAPTQSIIAEHAAGPKKDDLSCSPFCETLAESDLVFPDESILANTYPYRTLNLEEEAAWNDLFQQVTQG
jgi:spermidine/putrescine transport system substrate-binding protein